MKDIVHKIAQIVGAWIVVLTVFGWLWPTLLGISQLWFLVIVTIVANVLQPSYRFSEGSRNQIDKGTARQIVWTVYGSQLLALVELGISARQSMEWDALSWGAAILITLGLALRTWAVLTLGNYFTWNIEVAQGQTVITSGPYRFLRHPSYSGAWLTYVFSCVLLQSWYASIAAAVGLSLAFVRRTRYEEQILCKEVTGYNEYCLRVPRFLPKF